MVVKGKSDALRGIIGLVVVATTLTGCGGSGADSGSSSANSADAQISSATGTIALSSSSYQVDAGSSAIVTVYRSGSGSGQASVDYTTVNGNAVAGTDYTATTGSLTWSDGDTGARSVVVPVRASATGKSFAISLTGVEGSAGFGDPASASIQVVSASAGTSSRSGATSSSGTTAATLSWTPPTENTNGSALTNLIGYNIYYGTSSGAMTNKIAINTVGVTNYVIQNIQSGKWYFAMTSVNSGGVESTVTSTVQATL